jgi:hypothetical protein
MPGVMVKMEVYLYLYPKEGESSFYMMGEKNGLILNALLMFKSGTTSEDYHHEMNFKTLKDSSK